MEEKRCAHCGCPLDSNPRAKNQRYCGKKECQRARKKSWQKGKMATDPDYKANQQECQKTWRGGNPDYWRKYRESHPRYEDRNRVLQKARRGRHAAKMDASEMDLFAGIGHLLPDPGGGVAKMDASARKVVLVPVA